MFFRQLRNHEQLLMLLQTHCSRLSNSPRHQIKLQGLQQRRMIQAVPNNRQRHQLRSKLQSLWRTSQAAVPSSKRRRLNLFPNHRILLQPRHPILHRRLFLQTRSPKPLSK